jgi:hypothetical protein
MRVPQLADFEPYRIVDSVDLHGVVVPGLRAVYLWNGKEIATAYSYGRRDLFAAWGYDDEEHCRYFAVLGADGRWEDPQPGCPRARAIKIHGRLLGVAVRSRTGVWLVSEPPPTASTADGGSTGHLTAVGGPAVVPQSRVDTTTVCELTAAATALNG